VIYLKYRSGAELKSDQTYLVGEDILSVGPLEKLDQNALMALAKANPAIGFYILANRLPEEKTLESYLERLSLYLEFRPSFRFVVSDIGVYHWFRSNHASVRLIVDCPALISNVYDLNSFSEAKGVILYDDIYGRLTGRSENAVLYCGPKLLFRSKRDVLREYRSHNLQSLADSGEFFEHSLADRGIRKLRYFADRYEFWIFDGQDYPTDFADQDRDLFISLGLDYEDKN
jgi:hypothetical protein